MYIGVKYLRGFNKVFYRTKYFRVATELTFSLFKLYFNQENKRL